MNCYFCHKELIYEQKRLKAEYPVYKCTNHPVAVWHYFKFSALSILVIDIFINNILYNVIFGTPSSAITKEGDVDIRSDNLRITLTTNNITPENCQQYVERLLNMKAFL